MYEDSYAQVMHDARRELSSDVDLHALEQRTGERERHVDRTAHRNHAKLTMSRDHAVIDGVFREERTGLHDETEDNDEQ